MMQKNIPGRKSKVKTQTRRFLGISCRRTFRRVLMVFLVVILLLCALAVVLAVLFLNVETVGVPLTEALLRQLMPRPEKYFRVSRDASEWDGVRSIDHLFKDSKRQMDALMMEGLSSFPVPVRSVTSSVCDVLVELERLKPGSDGSPRSDLFPTAFVNHMCKDEKLDEFSSESPFFFHFHRPSVTKYGPHQWLWDSCFHIMTNSHSNVTSALLEFHSLLAFQNEETGMIPEMTYWFPDGNQHGVPGEMYGYSDPERRFTDITQMPMMMYAVNRILNGLKETFGIRDQSGSHQVHVQKLVAKLEMALKSRVQSALLYWRKYRDVDGNGLVSIIHPWESGLDASPLYDPVFGYCMHQSIARNEEVGDSDDGRSTPCPPAPAELYPKFVVLLYRYRHHYGNWNLKRVQKSPNRFDVEDIGLNAILLDNMYLSTDSDSATDKLAPSMEGDKVRQTLKHEMLKSSERMTLQLLDFIRDGREIVTQKSDKDHLSKHRMLSTGFPSRGFCQTEQRYKFLTTVTIQQLMLLLPFSNERFWEVLSDVAVDRLTTAADVDEMVVGYVRELLDLLDADEVFNTAFPVPTTAASETLQFDPNDSSLMWRGPTWPTTNWFIIESLRRLATHSRDSVLEKHFPTGGKIQKQANKILDQLLTKWLRMHATGGLHEYFNPLSGAPLGQKGLGMSLNVVDWLSYSGVSPRGHGASNRDKSSGDLFSGVMQHAVEIVFRPHDSESMISD